MAAEGGEAAWHPGLLEEDAQHFDFVSFYKQSEFCDRTIRVEILEKYMTECDGGTADTLSQVPSSAPPASGNERQPAQANTRSNRPTRNKRKEHPDNEVGSSQKKLCKSGAAQDRWSEEIPVNSIVLAAKSRVLRKMLSNGMRESDKSKPVLLKVTPEEKVAFKEMLHFLYTGSLSTAVLQKDTSVRTLVDLLMVGDKFEVRSFMGAVLKAISERETTVPDSIELALRAPEVLEQHPQIKEVVTKAREHFVETFKDAYGWADSPAFLALEQDAIRFLLQSDLLEADSEENIFNGVRAWLHKNRFTLTERREGMVYFSPLIRFGCMRGEYLLNSVLPDPLMSLSNTQQRVKHGINLRAYSDDRRAITTDPSVQERRGILQSHLEILCNFTMEDDYAILRSRMAKWLGRGWKLQFQQTDPESEDPTVGIFLTSTSSDNESAAIKAEFQFYVRTWPNGLWKNLEAKLAHDFSDESPSWGHSDALRMSRSKARVSEEFIGSTGEMTLKVVIWGKSS